MGFAVFFKRLFGGNKTTHPVAAINSIDITGTGLSIDGVPVDMPTLISALERLLGKPRAIQYKTDNLDMEFMERQHGKGMIVKRVNYA